MSQSMLRQVYEQAWPKLSSALAASAESDRLSYPLLIDIEAHNYLRAPKKLFVIGQQTSTWYGRWSDLRTDANPISRLLGIYREFQLGRDVFLAPFWSAAHRIYRDLNPCGPPDGFAWSNLIKMDEDGECPRWGLEQLIRETFNVLPSEIELAKPDVAIFFTGPDYDETIEEVFGQISKIEIRPYSERLLIRIQDSKGRLPVHSYRTCHPGYFAYSGKPAHLADIIETVRKLVA